MCVYVSVRVCACVYAIILEGNKESPLGGQSRFTQTGSTRDTVKALS